MDNQKNINVVVGESISFNTVIEIGKTTRRYDLNFSFSILFKDGKIRYDRPVLKEEDGWR
ncbi:hypothetical protein [Empedobacter brevis]|uniref:hypothetical protein n=1 Tax=Empedobacter brevis TaxID=247 RepID=UPI0028986CAE|nr:hypothetical protein [Empedobacter brevis]